MVDCCRYIRRIVCGLVNVTNIIAKLFAQLHPISQFFWRITLLLLLALVYVKPWRLWSWMSTFPLRTFTNYSVFFLHERGAILTYYTAALCLAAIAPLPAGYMLPKWTSAY